MEEEEEVVMMTMMMKHVMKQMNTLLHKIMKIKNKITAKSPWE